MYVLNLGNGTGKPAGIEPATHTPTRGIPLPITPRVYPSKQGRKRPKRPRNEWVIANFDEFHEISCNSLSFGPKIMFSGLF